MAHIFMGHSFVPAWMPQPQSHMKPFRIADEGGKGSHQQAASLTEQQSSCNYCGG